MSEIYGEITFQDNGQDFLRWFIDKNMQVVRCEPFQGWHWKEFKVLTQPEVGKPIQIQSPQGEVFWLKHLVEEYKVNDDALEMADLDSLNLVPENVVDGTDSSKNKDDSCGDSCTL